MKMQEFVFYLFISITVLLTLQLAIIVKDFHRSLIRNSISLTFIALEKTLEVFNKFSDSIMQNSSLFAILPVPLETKTTKLCQTFKAKLGTCTRLTESNVYQNVYISCSYSIPNALKSQNPEPTRYSDKVSTTWLQFPAPPAPSS